jgi:hypothetical protein
MSIKDIVIPFIKKFIDMNACWEYLENKCEAKLGFRKLMLLKGIVSLKKEENESMNYFFKGNKKKLCIN